MKRQTALRGCGFVPDCCDHYATETPDDIRLRAGLGDDAVPAGDVMMELVERAIPVIQHPPETSRAAEPRRPAAAAATPAAATPAVDQPNSEADPREQTRAAAIDSAVAHAYQTLDRMRSQQAQLTSGAVLQQYQRQVTFEVEDSRPATKVLSVKG